MATQSLRGKGKRTSNFLPLHLSHYKSLTREHERRAFRRMYSQHYLYCPLKLWKMFDVFSFFADFLNLQDVHYQGKHEFSARSIYGGVECFEDVQILRHVIANSIDGKRLMDIIDNNNLSHILHINVKLSRQIVQGLRKYWQMTTDASFGLRGAGGGEEERQSAEEVEELEQCMRSRVKLLKDEMRLKSSRRRIKPLQAELRQAQADAREVKGYLLTAGEEAEGSQSKRTLKQLMRVTTGRLHELEDRLRHLHKLVEALEEQVNRQREASEKLEQTAAASHESRQKQQSASLEKQRRAETQQALHKENVEFEVSMIARELKHLLTACHAPALNRQQRMDRKLRLDGIMQLVLFAQSMSSRTDMDPRISSKLESLKQSCSLLLDMCQADKYLDIVESQLALSRECRDDYDDAQEALSRQLEESRRALELATEHYRRTGGLETVRESMSMLEEEVASLDDRLARVQRRKQSVQHAEALPEPRTVSDDSDDQPYVNESAFRRMLGQVIEQEKEAALRDPAASLYSLQLWFVSSREPPSLHTPDKPAPDPASTSPRPDSPDSAESDAVWALNLDLPA